MPVFDRTIGPDETDPPRSNAAPLQSPALNSRMQTRETLAAGFRWTESWPALDINDAAVRGFLAEIDAWFRAGTPVDVRPFHWRTAMGTIAAGDTGAVSGAGQSGATINTTGWTPGGTVEKGDYVSIAGVGYAQKIMAPATADGSGNISLSLDPPIWAGNEPADTAVVTLNGLLSCYILEWTVPHGVAADADYHRRLSVTFVETRA